MLRFKQIIPHNAPPQYVVLQVEVATAKGNKNCGYKPAKSIKGCLPLPQRKTWLYNQACSIVKETLRKYVNYRSTALKKGGSRFSETDSLAIQTITNKILNQSNFNALCKAIVAHQRNLTWLLHGKQATKWNIIIPQLINWANEQ